MFARGDARGSRHTPPGGRAGISQVTLQAAVSLMALPRGAQQGRPWSGSCLLGLENWLLLLDRSSQQTRPPARGRLFLSTSEIPRATMGEPLGLPSPHTMHTKLRTCLVRVVPSRVAPSTAAMPGPGEKFPDHRGGSFSSLLLLTVAWQGGPIDYSSLQQAPSLIREETQVADRETGGLTRARKRCTLRNGSSR